MHHTSIGNTNTTMCSKTGFCVANCDGIPGKSCPGMQHFIIVFVLMWCIGNGEKEGRWTQWRV